jgi:phosphoserine aminotransferase
MSSCILSEPVDVSKFGVIYACAQKNIGPAGVTFVIIREDLISDFPEDSSVPVMLRYKTYADEDSLYNTPPTYAIYICKLVLEWIEARGGLAAMKEHNEKKAAVLYDYLDAAKLFKSTVSERYRSIMNVPFVTGDGDLDAKFIKEAGAEGFVNLKGHRSVGGMRASIYNAMPPEGVRKLVDFMKEFERVNV